MRLSILALLVLTACPALPTDPEAAHFVGDTDTAASDTAASDTAASDTAEPGTDTAEPEPMDVDGDGFDVASGDCDDADAAVHPGAVERCNTVDDDCDGTVDPETSLDALTLHPDADDDGFGDAGTVWVACSVNARASVIPGDCDDTDATVFPGAVEVCNDRDDDCDGTVDPGSSADVATWYVDADRDGFGDPTRTAHTCDAPRGFTADATDCDDDDDAHNPGAAEVCGDGIDQDCSGEADDDGTCDG